jgi:YVTN family beta-propeller protein
MQIAVNPVTNRVYVANLNDNTVSVIDGASNTVVDTVAVGVIPEVVAVNTVTNRIYVANSSSNTISAIDGNTDTVVGTISSPYTTFLAVNSVTNRIYAGNQLASTVYVFDGSTNNLVASIFIPGSSTIPESLVVNPVTNLVYIGVAYGSEMVVISGETNSIIHTVPFPRGQAVGWLTADFALDRVYMIAQHEVCVFDTAKNAFTKTVDLSSFNTPYEAAVESNHELVVSDYYGGFLIRVNPWHFDVDGSTGNGKNPSGIAINPNTRTMYVADTFSNVVTVIKLP